MFCKITNGDFSQAGVLLLVGIKGNKWTQKPMGFGGSSLERCLNIIITSEINIHKNLCRISEIVASFL